MDACVEWHVRSGDKEEQLSGVCFVFCRDNKLPDDASGGLRGSKEWIKGVLAHVPDLRL